MNAVVGGEPVRLFVLRLLFFFFTVKQRSIFLNKESSVLVLFLFI